MTSQPQQFELEMSQLANLLGSFVKHDIHNYNIALVKSCLFFAKISCKQQKKTKYFNNCYNRIRSLEIIVWIMFQILLEKLSGIQW